MDPEVRRFFNEMGKHLKALSKPFTLERLKLLSNFTIAGAIIFTGITIQGKSFNPIVTTGSTGLSGPLEVVVTELPKGPIEVSGYVDRRGIPGKPIKIELEQVPGGFMVNDTTIRPYRGH